MKATQGQHNFHLQQNFFCGFAPPTLPTTSSPVAITAGCAAPNHEIEQQPTVSSRNRHTRTSSGMGTDLHVTLSDIAIADDEDEVCSYDTFPSALSCTSNSISCGGQEVFSDASLLDHDADDEDDDDDDDDDDESSTSSVHCHRPVSCMPSKRSEADKVYEEQLSATLKRLGERTAKGASAKPEKTFSCSGGGSSDHSSDNSNGNTNFHNYYNNYESTLKYEMITSCRDKEGARECRDFLSCARTAASSLSPSSSESEVLSSCSWAAVREIEDEQTTEHNEDDPIIQVRILPDDFEYTDENPEPRRILRSRKIMRKLQEHCPVAIHTRSWKRLYSLARDGDSFGTFLRLTAKYQHTMIVVETTKGDLLGGFADTKWIRGSLSKAGHFFGTGQSFLFSIHDDDEQQQKRVKVHKWTGRNECYQYCAGQAGYLGMGGGGTTGSFGLFLYDGFAKGSSGPCETFGNDKPLAKQEYFDIYNMEVYGFVQPY